MFVSCYSQWKLPSQRNPIVLLVALKFHLWIIDYDIFNDIEMFRGVYVTEYLSKFDERLDFWSGEQIRQKVKWITTFACKNDLIRINANNYRQKKTVKVINRKLSLAPLPPPKRFRLSMLIGWLLYHCNRMNDAVSNETFTKKCHIICTLVTNSNLDRSPSIRSTERNKLRAHFFQLTMNRPHITNVIQNLKPRQRLQDPQTFFLSQFLLGSNWNEIWTKKKTSVIHNHRGRCTVCNGRLVTWATRRLIHINVYLIRDAHLYLVGFFSRLFLHFAHPPRGIRYAV